MERIESRTGWVYYLTKLDKGYMVQRQSGNTVSKITESLLRRTQSRLLDGEEIPFKGISSTLAIEVSVLHILRDIIEIDKENQVYRLKIYTL